MAASLLCGFEMGHVNEANSTGNVSPNEGNKGVVQSVTVRTGTFALKCTPTATIGATVEFQRRTAAGFDNIFQSCRFYMQVLALPSSTELICSAGGVLSLRLTSTGTLQLWSSSTIRATSTNALSVDGLWHRIEWDNGWSSGNGTRVFVDGVSWATNTTDVGITPQGAGQLGCNTNGTILAFDDVVWDNSTLGGARASDYEVILLKPVSDNARGTNWTAGAGGTTNLFDAVNNSPPVGVADASATNLSQIRNAAKDTTGNYDANCTSYTAAGIAAADTINSVMALCNDAQAVFGVALGGAVVIVSNPSGQTETAFDFEDNGSTNSHTFPTGWTTHVGPVTASPTVTLGTQPVVRVGKRVSSKTAVDIDFMGIYVDYTPAVVAFAPPPERRQFAPLIRASHWFSAVRWKRRREGLVVPALTEA